MFQTFHLANAVADGLRPPPPMTLSEWADTYAVLSAESAATPGPWHSYPYQRGILDAFTDPHVERISFMKSTRVGYTKIIGHSVAFHVAHDPLPQMVVQPTVDDAEGYSKEEIAPMLANTPILHGLVGEAKSRNSGSTILRKSYPGGFLVMTGANSARGFRRISVARVYLDEVDAYPPSAGLEGDQVKLATRRTDDYWNRKIVVGGTPTVRGISRIEYHFGISDQRYYHIDCPTCGHSHALVFKNLKWPKDNPHRAHFICPKCKGIIEERDKFSLIESGRWVATADAYRHAGFKIWGAYSYSPKTSWGHIAREFLEVKDNPDLLKTFINTVLGDLWEDEGDRVETADVVKRSETYGRKLSNDILIITAGADVQKDRIECEIVGWAAGFESFSLEYLVLPGDPHMVETWNSLDGHLMRVWEREDGVKLKVHTAFIDSGYATQDVYKFCYPRQPRGVFASRGQPKAGNQLVQLSKKKYKRGLKLWNVATIGAKDKIYSYLRIDEPGPGYCHFPDHYDQEYFDQLTAEQRKTKFVKGVATYYYAKIRTRNEALDCRVGALAALEKADPQWSKLARRLVARATAKAKAADDDNNQPTKKGRRVRRRPGGFVNGWKI